MLPTLLEVVRQLKTEQNNAERWAKQHFQTVEDGCFSARAINQEEFILAPYPEFGALIYRGQNQFYEPCLPSLGREKPTKVERLINTVRLAEFELLLANHPAVQDCQQWSLMGLRFKVDYEALAQHYLLKTGLLDFSSNPVVAAFFACSEFNYDEQTYRPILSDRRPPGVLYRLNAAADISVRYDNPYSGTVGFQPLRRPAEQYAWSYRLPKRASLNSQRFLSIYEFIHSPKDSIAVFEVFEGGTKLFPHDIVSVKAQQVIATKRLSREALELAISRSKSTWKKHSAMNAFARKGVEVTDKSEIMFSPQELVEMRSDWDTRRPDLISRIRWRLAR